MLQLNDRTVYVAMDGRLVNGTVVEVIEWTGGKPGFTCATTTDRRAVGRSI